MNTTVKNLFKRFCEVYNLKTSATRDQATDFLSNDFITLDYNPQYGGYRLDVVQVNTSERFFDGGSRKTAKEMIAYLTGLITAKCDYCFEGIIKELEPA